jgi:hypothetical protein
MKIVRFHKRRLLKRNKVTGMNLRYLQVMGYAPNASLIYDHYYFMLDLENKRIIRNRTYMYPILVDGIAYNISGRFLEENENPKIEQLFNL